MSADFIKSILRTIKNPVSQKSYINGEARQITVTEDQFEEGAAEYMRRATHSRVVVTKKDGTVSFVMGTSNEAAVFPTEEGDTEPELELSGTAPADKELFDRWLT